MKHILAISSFPFVGAREWDDCKGDGAHESQTTSLPTLGNNGRGGGGVQQHTIGKGAGGREGGGGVLMGAMNILAVAHLYLCTWWELRHGWLKGDQLQKDEPPSFPGSLATPWHPTHGC